jgi:hypothetical protein
MSILSNLVSFYQSPMLSESNQRALVISENHLNSIPRKSAAGHDEIFEGSARR